jgi:tripartite-type tricarboxylate transporter receptor subunit TctC
MFKTMAGVDLAMVNYKSSPTALNDLMGGQLHFICEPVATVMPHVRAGKLRALGITSPTRVDGAPDVPSIAEAGLPGFEYSAWVGVFAPAGTPRDIIARLSRDIAVVLNQPDTAKRIQNAGFDPMVGGPEELAALLKKEMDRAVKVVKDAGIQPE